MAEQSIDPHIDSLGGETANGPRYKPCNKRNTFCDREITCGTCSKRGITCIYPRIMVPFDPCAKHHQGCDEETPTCRTCRQYDRDCTRSDRNLSSVPGIGTSRSTKSHEYRFLKPGKLTAFRISTISTSTCRKRVLRRDSCIRLREGCDKERPTCATCQRYGRDCTWSSRNLSNLACHRNTVHRLRSAPESYKYQVLTLPTITALGFLSLLRS